jgi:hypothetical protein
MKINNIKKNRSLINPKQKNHGVIYFANYFSKTNTFTFLISLNRLMDVSMKAAFKLVYEKKLLLYNRKLIKSLSEKF